MSSLLATAMIALLALSSCSRDQVSRDELSSDLTSASSLASEAETFIDFVGQSRSTDNYKKAHIQYVSEEAAKLAKNLHRAKPGTVPEDQLNNCKKEVDALALELNRTARDIETSHELASHKQRLAVVREALQQLRASL